MLTHILPFLCLNVLSIGYYYACLLLYSFLCLFQAVLLAISLVRWSHISLFFSTLGNKKCILLCLSHNSIKERLLRCLGLVMGMRTFLINAEVQQLKESNLRN